MATYGHSQTRIETFDLLAALQDAFRSRQILTYREGVTLVVNDPYLRRPVEVTTDERWFWWWSPAGERKFGDPEHLADVVDDIIRQYAGIYMQDH